MGKFPTFAHFGQHKTTTTQRGKRPFGLFWLGIRRGIPVCPHELENTLALHGTDQRKNYRASPRCGLDTNDAGGEGRDTSLSLWPACSRVGWWSWNICLELPALTLSGQAFPSSAPAGREQLPSQPVHACSNHINHKACFYLVKPLSSEVFRLVWYNKAEW